MSDYIDYDAVLERIKNSTDAVDAQYKKVDDASESVCDINQTVSQISNMSVVRDNGGNVVGYDYVYSTPKLPDTGSMEVDSNTDTGSYGTATGGGGSTGGGGAGRYAGSYYSTGMSGAKSSEGSPSLISGYINTCWGAVSALSKLGKGVASDAADFIQSVGNRVGDTFKDILVSGTDWTADAIRVLFGVDDETGDTNMYMDEDTLGALAIASRDEGAFAEGEWVAPEISGISPPGLRYPLYFNVTNFFYTKSGKQQPLSATSNVHATILRYGSTNSTMIVLATFTSGVQVTHNYTTKTMTQATNYGYTYYYWGVTSANYESDTVPTNITDINMNSISAQIVALNLLLGGQEEIVPGISDQTGATIPVDAITGADPHVVAQNLANQYPDVMGDPIQIVVMDDSCNEVTKNYYKVPISYSPTNVNINVQLTGSTQITPTFNPTVELPDIDMSKWIEQIINQLDGGGAGRGITNPTDPDDPDAPDVSASVLPITPPTTGEGVTPPTVLPETNVTAMWHVYNPSSSELSALGSWLWSSSIIDMITKLFSNPLDSIIGVHAIYGTPQVSSSASIVVGNLTSNVSARVVSAQYTTVDCGSVWLTEYFGNAFDYDPYTKVSLFLPFIGIVQLNTYDVMRAELHVVYNIDVYTGACIAMVEVSRDGAGGVVYQYGGNCAVEYPVSGVAYNNIISGIIGAGLSIAGMAASGNPAVIAGAGISGMSSAISTRAQHVSRSGAFSGNVGAMGIKIPYLIITRPQTNMAINYERYDGRGSNYVARVGDCTGYIKCKEVHLNVPGAYKSELDEIERLLKEGIIVD